MTKFGKRDRIFVNLLEWELLAYVCLSEKRMTTRQKELLY